MVATHTTLSEAEHMFEFFCLCSNKEMLGHLGILGICIFVCLCYCSLFKVSTSLVGLHPDNLTQMQWLVFSWIFLVFALLLIHIAKKYIAPCMLDVVCFVASNVKSLFSRHESPLEIAQRMKCADMVARMSEFMVRVGSKLLNLMVVSDDVWSYQILVLNLRCPQNLASSGATAINDCHRCSYTAKRYLMHCDILSLWQKALYIINISSDGGAMHALS